jgi:hypothetical protein
MRSPSAAVPEAGQSDNPAASPFLLPSLNTNVGQALMRGRTGSIADPVRSADLPELLPSESPHVRGARLSATTLASARPTGDMSEAGASTADNTPAASQALSSTHARATAAQRRDVWSDNPAFSTGTTPHSSVNPSLDPVPVRAPFPPALTPAAGNTPTRVSQPMVPRTPGTPEPLDSGLPTGVYVWSCGTECCKPLVRATPRLHAESEKVACA